MNTRNKWNRKHQDRLNQQIDQPPNMRLKKLAPYLSGGRALDLACGIGSNSFFLANLNYEVDAYEISEVAVEYISEQALKKQLEINTYLFDLEDWKTLKLNTPIYDLVLITYYLDRSLFPFVKSIIKEKGYFFMETFYMSPRNASQGVSDQYKLKADELRLEFSDWKILYYEENEFEGRQTIFCKKT